jgi:galactokinase
VNIIGEHTDYNDGLVLPMAIDMELVVCARARADRILAVTSTDLSQTREFNPEAAQKPVGWLSYIAGVQALLEAATGPLGGADLVIASDIPRGSGLSSSAALEAGTALALLALAGRTMPGERIAELCREAEHEWAGVQCGIMDQYACLLGHAGHALLIDCRTLTHTQVPVPPDARFVIAGSGNNRVLAASAYNLRVAECAHAAGLLRVASLRDVRPDRADSLIAELPEPLGRRARHVVTEIDRTVRAAAALRADDLRTCGALMNASHESLRDDYDVSSDALDTLVETARALPGVCGSRLTGAGFGGYAITLVESHHAAAVAEQLHGRVVAAWHGAGIISSAD